MSEGTEKPQRRYVYRKKKVCKFCEEKIPFIDYKDVNLLRLFVPERGRVLPKRRSGVCSSHQRQLRNAIKRARVVALVPFAADSF